MAIPDFQSVMLPLLREVSDGRERTLRELTDTLADEFVLTVEERKQLIPSEACTVFYSRVAWAKTYLKAAGLVENPVRGRFRITADGRSLLAETPTFLNMKFLEKYPSFIEFRERAKKKDSVEVSETQGDVREKTPVEQLESAFLMIQESTKDELLSRLRTCSWRFFERAVMKLLLAMGYGGVSGSGQVTGQSGGDGGIDGVIREDKLGLDVVCIQAKRWQGTVGRGVVQQFVGSMDFVRAKKGVILTTAAFSNEATSFVDRIEGKKVVLIDGIELADLMIAYKVGVTITNVYEVQEVSNDFFDDDNG